MEASRESRSALLTGDYGRSPARSTCRLAVSTTSGVHSFQGGATWARSGREGHRAGGSRTPHGPLTQRRRCPRTQTWVYQAFTRKQISIRLGSFWTFLSPPLEGDKGMADRTELQANQHPRPTSPPGSLDMNPRKVQSQHCDQKRSFGKFFSKRDHEFCPLECPRAVLIGSVALTQNEHSSTLR